MVGPGEMLREQPRLRSLLDHYRECRRRNPDAEWSDRLMEAPGWSADDLSRTHGALIANGWVETRVDIEALATPGQLKGCYRITRAGLIALRLAEEYGLLEEDVEEMIAAPEGEWLDAA